MKRKKQPVSHGFFSEEEIKAKGFETRSKREGKETARLISSRLSPAELDLWERLSARIQGARKSNF